MNHTQRGIIALLKSAVTEEAQPLPEGFSVEQAMDLIHRHGIATLAYDGAVRCGISRQEPAMSLLFRAYLQYLLKSDGQMEAAGKLFAAFDEACIDYMPLKGCRMKHLYPKPELRPMGDADVLIRLDQYKKIRPILVRLGYEEKNDSDYELIWDSRSLHLELHSRLISSDNKDFYACFGDGWQLAKIREGTRFSMVPEDEFVYLFTHFSRHFRDGGIGCRHMTDLWVFLNRHPELDMACVEAQLDSLQLLGFYGNVRRTVAVWFEEGQPDPKTDLITELVFSGGSFGENTTRMLSRVVRNMVRNGSRNGKLTYLRSIAFPGVNVLKHKYRILRRAPWLLPAVWLVRPFYKLLFERRSLKKQEENLSALSPEMIRARRKTLEYLEVEYRF